MPRARPGRTSSSGCTRPRTAATRPPGARSCRTTRSRRSWGRVCYHPCQTACNRAQLDTEVGINSVERFLGDEAIRQGWELPPVAAPTGHRVLVVGAGPSGLSAAYQLARLGHAVTVRDAQPDPGGMMRYGIPAYRLPRDVLDAETARILALGVVLERRTTVEDVVAASREFDAVYLAVGARLGHRTDI